MTFHSYANPTGRCVECGGSTPTLPACCDVSDPVPRGQSCPVQDTCDTALFYCLRALRSTGLCPQSEQITAPAALFDTRDFNFDSTFFGLDNPVVFNRAEPWQVSQLLLGVQSLPSCFAYACRDFRCFSSSVNALQDRIYALWMLI